jgi:hypothetical protein
MPQIRRKKAARPRCKRKQWTLFVPGQAVCFGSCCDVPWINAQVRFAHALGPLVRDDVGDLRRVGGGVVEWRGLERRK